jgi:hypothetical protein
VLPVAYNLNYRTHSLTLQRHQVRVPVERLARHGTRAHSVLRVRRLRVLQVLVDEAALEEQAARARHHGLHRDLAGDCTHTHTHTHTREGVRE